MWEQYCQYLQRNTWLTCFFSVNLPFKIAWFLFFSLPTVSFLLSNSIGGYRKNKIKGSLSLISSSWKLIFGTIDNETKCRKKSTRSHWILYLDKQFPLWLIRK
jgi:hypothetical protein